MGVACTCFAGIMFRFGSIQQSALRSQRCFICFELTNHKLSDVVCTEAGNDGLCTLVCLTEAGNPVWVQVCSDLWAAAAAA